MKIKSTSLLPLIILTACLLLMACGAAKGLLAVAVGVDETVTVKRELAAQGEMSRESELAFTKSLLDGDRAMIQVTETAECFEAFTADAKTAITTGLDQTIRGLEDLQAQGILRIKSERGRKRFAQVITGARLSASGIRTALEFIPVAEPGAPPPELNDKQRRDLEAFRATCRRAAEIFRRSEKRLEEDLIRLQPPA